MSAESQFRRQVQEFGFDYDRVRSELAALNMGTTPGEVAWEAGNRRLVAQHKAQDWHGMSMTYLGMALVVWWDADTDVAPARSFDLQDQANVAVLKAYSDHGVQKFQVGGCACRVCARDAGRKVTYASQVKTRIIPHRNCEEGWCGCEFSPVR